MPVAPAAAAASVPIAAAAAASVPGGRLFIDPASGRLPPESIELLARVAEAARSTEGALVEISGFYPPGGNAGASAGFAREHAEAVRHALEANGVSPRRMRVAAVEAAPEADARDAARVEIWVR